MGQIVYPYTAIWFHIFINKDTFFLFTLYLMLSLIMCNPKGLPLFEKHTSELHVQLVVNDCKSVISLQVI